MNEILRLLEDRGFRRIDEAEFRLGDLSATLDPGWIRFEAQSSGEDWKDDAAFSVLKPGLWKQIGHRYAADLPVALGAYSETGPECHPILALAIDWVLASHQDPADARWLPPPASTLMKWLPRSARTMRFDDRIAPIELESGTTLAARCHLFSSTFADISEDRRRWILFVLSEWQSAWRMVRIRRTNECLAAEIDLTWAPADVIEALLPAGVECLRHAWPRLISVLGVLGNPDMRLCAVPIPRHRAMARTSSTQPMKMKGGYK